MQLITIRAAGFAATVDACAQDEGQMWLLAGRRGVGHLALLQRRLPSGAAYHGLLVPELAAYAGDRRDFLLLARSADQAPGAAEG